MNRPDRQPQPARSHVQILDDIEKKIRGIRKGLRPDRSDHDRGAWNALAATEEAFWGQWLGVPEWYPTEEPEPAQPLDLDAIEARASLRLTTPVVEWAEQASEDLHALVAEVKRLRGEVDLAVANAFNYGMPQTWLLGASDLDDLRDRLTPPTLSPGGWLPDPLDESDHRDRVDRNGDIVRRRGPQGWWWPHTAAWKHGLHSALAEIDREYGPLTFADDPQPTPDAQNQPVAALGRAALAEVAEAAQRLSGAICDLLDGE